MLLATLLAAAAALHVVVRDGFAPLALLLLPEAVAETHAEGPLKSPVILPFIKKRRVERVAVGPVAIEGIRNVYGQVGPVFKESFLGTQRVVQVGRPPALQVK